MKLYTTATIHEDRISDLAMIAGKNSVTISSLPAGVDGMVEVLVSGDADVISKLDQSIERVNHILTSPVVLEWS